MNIDGLHIRAMTVKDLEDIMVLENLSFRIPWSRSAFEEELRGNTFARYLVADLNGKAVGYAGMWKVYDEGHITNIAVHPEFRRAGIAAALLEALISLAAAEGIERMTLEVRQGNLAAKSLYMKYGFMDCGIRKGYYADNGEDAVIMWKEDVQPK